jgi:hypothetical protein
MGTYLDIDGDPNEISGKGAVLQGIADGFKAKIQGLQAKIGAVEAEKPWGNDKFGHAAEETYTKEPKGKQPLREGVSEAMSGAGDTLSRLGGNVVRAMNQYQGEEYANEVSIKQVHLKH